MIVNNLYYGNAQQLSDVIIARLVRMPVNATYNMTEPIKLSYNGTEYTDSFQREVLAALTSSYGSGTDSWDMVMIETEVTASKRQSGIARIDIMIYRPSIENRTAIAANYKPAIIIELKYASLDYWRNQKSISYPNPAYRGGQEYPSSWPLLPPLATRNQYDNASLAAYTQQQMILANTAWNKLTDLQVTQAYYEQWISGASPKVNPHLEYVTVTTINNQAHLQAVNYNVPITPAYAAAGIIGDDNALYYIFDGFGQRVIGARVT